jgi:diaminobutyrate-2-oxoglutarate transaminase
MGISEERESAVRGCCRKRPVLFGRTVGSCLYHEGHRAYLAFSTGAGALSRGHNNPVLKRALLDYLTGDRVIHSPAPKPARKFIGRTKVITFTNCFHGMTLGAWARRFEVTPLELRRCGGHAPAPRCQPRRCANDSRRRTPQSGTPVSGALTIARVTSQLYSK